MDALGRGGSTAWVRGVSLSALLVLCLGCATPPSPEPYVFAWPFIDQPMQPRGGTTRGAAVTLATQPSAAWQRLQSPALDARARDRAAILAMAGDYRVSFDFLETVLFTPGAAPARPYRSWGTERIYVVEAREDFVSLQHIMEMFVVDDEGETQGPFVQKHWRQDWRYEPESVLVFAGNGRFELRPVPESERRGRWSQVVYQVDDSPRYGSLGRWTHTADASTWSGDETWRPLPRRESSVRSDYQVLAGRNRITILPTGWVHEQDNEKLVLSEGRQTPTRRLAREIGVNRYEQILGFDFDAADAYWQATAPFWALVREGFARRAEAGGFRLSKRCGDEPAFAPFFRYAGRLDSGERLSPTDQKQEVERLLDCVVSAG